MLRFIGYLLTLTILLNGLGWAANIDPDLLQPLQGEVQVSTTTDTGDPQTPAPETNNCNHGCHAEVHTTGMARVFVVYHNDYSPIVTPPAPISEYRSLDYSPPFRPPIV